VTNGFVPTDGFEASPQTSWTEPFPDVSTSPGGALLIDSSERVVRVSTDWVANIQLLDAGSGAMLAQFLAWSCAKSVVPPGSGFVAAFVADQTDVLVLMGAYYENVSTVVAIMTDTTTRTCRWVMPLLENVTTLSTSVQYSASLIPNSDGFFLVSRMINTSDLCDSANAQSTVSVFRMSDAKQVWRQDGVCRRLLNSFHVAIITESGTVWLRRPLPTVQLAADQRSEIALSAMVPTAMQGVQGYEGSTGRLISSTVAIPVPIGSTCILLEMSDVTRSICVLTGETRLNVTAFDLVRHQPAWTQLAPAPLVSNERITLLFYRTTSQNKTVLLIVGAHSVTAMNGNDGALLWSRQDACCSDKLPFPSMLLMNNVLILAYQWTIKAVRLDTGAVAWEAESLAALDPACQPIPASAGSRLIVCSRVGLQAFQIGKCTMIAKPIGDG